MTLLSLLACSLAAPPAEPAVPEPEPEVVEAPAPACPSTTADIETPEDPRLAGPAVIVVFKEARYLGLYAGGERQGCWSVGLAHTYNPGHKQQRGDLRTPEGWFRTSDKPWSSFYAAIAVHYPERADADRGRARGWITDEQRDAIHDALGRDAKPLQDTRLGGEILIHGGGGSSDWTLGCVALDDEDIDTLRTRLPRGMRTDVLILP